MSGTNEKNKGSKRKSSETEEQKEESTDGIPTGNQQPEEIDIEEETTVLKSQMESAKVDETWSSRKKPNTKFTLKHLDKVDSESVKKFITTAGSMSGTLPGDEVQQWFSDEAKEALDTMGLMDTRFVRWRQLGKQELCELLKEES